ncbi:SDR family NAD(P)-dependent oxidoreductase [Amycolatopsis minnesotensis]|uniref:SDR family NAD(P)-dependent oxidoreductase n=1 Tax=Amycolatopsis minnesotensis TaxID=337894 RepID=A0ABN2RF04_9PSEU
MAKKLAVVGAGPGLGRGVARAFDGAGFRIGLIARNAERLGGLASELRDAVALPADILDRDALTAALGEFGDVDALVYSPSPTGAITGAAETTVEAASAQLDLHVLGAVAAVGAVLPGMLARGSGTILLTTGASSAVPVPVLGNVGIAMAGLRNWAHALHVELAPKGVHVSTVTIATAIAAGGGAGDPDAIGARYFEQHERRNLAEVVVGDLDAVRRQFAPAR